MSNKWFNFSTSWCLDIAKKMIPKKDGGLIDSEGQVEVISSIDLKKGDILDGEGGFCARGKLITSLTSKNENILPLGLSDKAVIKNNIKKDEVIKLDDVDLNLPKEVINARNYQYSLI